MTESPAKSSRTREISRWLRRICEHLGIAFSANRVFPGLADQEIDSNSVPDSTELNVAGRIFGLRFRQMVGTSRDLVEVVSDNGPVLVFPRGMTGDSLESAILVLRVVGWGRLLIHRDGQDQVVSRRWLQRQLDRSPEREYRWLLIQPMLAAESASRIHYQGGEPGEPLKPLRRLWLLLKPERQDVRTILIFSIVVGLLSLTTPLAVEAMVNTIAFGRYLQPLLILSIIVFVFLAFRAFISVLMTIVTEVIQRKLFVRTVEDLAYRLIRVPLSTWKSYYGPELVNRFFDIVSVQKITSKLLLDSMMLFLQTVIGLTVLAFYHPFLLGYDVGLLALMTLAMIFLGRGAIRTANVESQWKYDTAAWLQEIVRHPLTFKFNGGLGYAINRADELAAGYVQHRQSHFRILIGQVTFAMFMQAVAATTLLALGGYLVIMEQMTLGQLVAAELIVTVILGSFAKLGKDLESFYDLMASVDKLGKLFDLPVEPVNKLRLVRQPGAYSSTLVDFRLDADHKQPASLAFQAGSITAVHGSGELRRSNLLNALVGQSRPAQGYVLLDDFRVDAIAAESLQEKVSLIRDIELFAGTIDENIRLGRESLGSQQVNQMVRDLGLRKVIAGLEQGHATRLQVGGYPLSTGEAIRLMLARSLIARPGVLLIDGLLDRLSDDDIRDVLQRLEPMASQTTIIISTGRQAIVDWAQQRLNLTDPAWNLENFDG